MSKSSTVGPRIPGQVTEPNILLSAQVGNDPGYFGERLNTAQQQLAHAWQERPVHLEPTALRTDILGALLVASQLFQDVADGEGKVLVIYSDMHQATPVLNLEAPAVAPVDSALRKIEKAEPLPDLKGIEVYALGVDAAGKDAAQWDSLRQFWAAYFETAGANLRIYSVLRELPPLRVSSVGQTLRAGRPTYTSGHNKFNGFNQNGLFDENSNKIIIPKIAPEELHNYDADGIIAKDYIKPLNINLTSHQLTLNMSPHFEKFR